MEEGLLVVEVLHDSPAEKAVIHGGDRTVPAGNTRIPTGGDTMVAIDGNATITT